MWPRRMKRLCSLLRPSSSFACSMYCAYNRSLLQIPALDYVRVFFSPVLLGLEFKRSQRTFHSLPSQNINVGTSRDMNDEMTDNNYASFFLSIVTLI